MTNTALMLKEEPVSMLSFFREPAEEKGSYYPVPQKRDYSNKYKLNSNVTLSYHWSNLTSPILFFLPTSLLKLGKILVRKNMETALAIAKLCKDG